MVVPTVLAITARRSCARCTDSDTEVDAMSIAVMTLPPDVVWTGPRFVVWGALANHLPFSTVLAMARSQALSIAPGGDLNANEYIVILILSISWGRLFRPFL